MFVRAQWCPLLSGPSFWLHYSHRTCFIHAVLTQTKRLAVTSPQKDPHTLYLEQELESLQVVLEIKNEQLHQQEKKLMEVGKLVRMRADGETACCDTEEKRKKNKSLNCFLFDTDREKCEVG